MSSRRDSTGPWRPEDPGRESGSSEARRWQPPRSAPRGPLALESAALRERIARRVRVLEIGAAVLVVLLLLGFWHLQVVRGSHYVDLAENNRLRRSRTRPPRGLILDRDGRVLAANRPAYNLTVVREDVEDLDSTFEWLARLLQRTPGELRQRLERHRELPAFRPVVVADDVSRKLVAAVEARQREYPGVQVAIEAKRHYPHGDLAAHLLGHVGEIGPERLEARSDDRFRMGDIIGQSGLEQTYDEVLSGVPGYRQTVVDSSGRTVRVVLREPARPGKSLVTTLDLELQRATEEALEGYRGAAVVLDVATGDVLAMASSPAYDPNAFAARFSAAEWTGLVNRPDDPLQNRALRGAYPPGSIFKLVLATAGLETGVISPGTTMSCGGSRVLYGHEFRCLAAHGPLELVEAIGRSCNVYFYEVGRRLGRERIVAAARQLGLGRPTGIDLPDESPGILPTDDWIARHRSGNWYPGETVSLSIGQGAIGVSALQLAHLAGNLASGRVVRTHLMDRIEDPETGATTARWTRPPRSLELDERTRRTVLRGMTAAVDPRGTARRARLTSVDVGGKTGTAQVAAADNVAAEGDEVPEKLRDHAWFVGLAPIDAPEVAVAVFLEHGGSGGRMAAPLGGRILDAWFRPGTESLVVGGGDDAEDSRTEVPDGP